MRLYATQEVQNLQYLCLSVFKFIKAHQAAELVPYLLRASNMRQLGLLEKSKRRYFNDLVVFIPAPSRTMNNGFQTTDNKQPEPAKVVEFLLVKSPPDPRPIIVKCEHRIRIQY